MKDNEKIVVAPSGRKYYRHSSGMGSVMCWDDNGTYRETMILDMKYHNVMKYWGIVGRDASIINKYKDAPFIGQTNNWYILGSSSTTPSDYDGQTDDVLNAKFNWIDEHVSIHNTDALVKAHSSSDYAANFCRSILVDNEGCDLPNMQTLVRIFCDRATIHSLDKSDTNNNWSSWFGGLCVWSSSEYNSNNSWNVNNNGNVDYDVKSINYYVIPVYRVRVLFERNG